MSGFDQQTLDFYAAEARHYVGVRPDDVTAELKDFLHLLPAGARILELGCGGGQDAEYMLAQGFDVEPTDGVAAMAAEAEARLGRPVKVMRFNELAVVSEYDAVVANASLLHVPTADLPDVLARICRALKPGGQHLASFKTAAEQGRDEHGRYYNYLSRDDADVLYHAAGEWASIEYDERQGVGYFSKPARWLHIIARKEN